VHNTDTFAENNGKITLTVYVKVVKVLPAAAQALAGMEECWSQSLERLAASLQ
jgi:hypothetical protein